MILTLLGLSLGAGLLYMGRAFYRSIDWEEPAEPSPDLRALRKKEAELHRVEELLAEAHQQGRLSQGALEEFDRYCRAEIQGIQAIETAWKQRRKKR